jgi:hypothetical protein
VSVSIITNARVVAVEFGAAAGKVDDSAAKVVRHHTQLLNTRVKARASGRPGPRVITGDYRRSLVWNVRQFGPSVVGQVGTNNPQGRRLEYGFTGVDALGRYYDQPPFPHFGPALDETQAQFIKDLSDVVIDAIPKGHPAAPKAYGSYAKVDLPKTYQNPESLF